MAILLIEAAVPQWVAAGAPMDEVTLSTDFNYALQYLIDVNPNLQEHPHLCNLVARAAYKGGDMTMRQFYNAFLGYERDLAAKGQNDLPWIEADMDESDMDDC